MKTREYSVIKMAQGIPGPQILADTVSGHEAKRIFNTTRIEFGEQVILRVYAEGKSRVLNTRDNGYCS